MNDHAVGATAHRRHEILGLVRERPVRSQEELGRLLGKRGFAVTQPTLSRDVKALGLAKTSHGYVAPDTAPSPVADVVALDRVLRQTALSVVAAGTLVVVRTPPALAAPLSRTIDELALPGVVGTLAGDDTVFVATPSAAKARTVARRLFAPISPRGRRPIRPRR